MVLCNKQPGGSGYEIWAQQEQQRLDSHGSCHRAGEEWNISLITVTSTSLRVHLSPIFTLFVALFLGSPPQETNMWLCST